MRRWLAILRRVGAAMLGVGDYDAYARHMASHHPGRPVLSPKAFFRNRQEARYGGKSGGRCC